MTRENVEVSRRALSILVDRVNERNSTPVDEHAAEAVADAMDSLDRFGVVKVGDETIDRT